MIKIRPLAADDHAGWDRLWQGYLAYYETSLPDADRAVAFGRLLEPDSKLHGLVAERDGQVVGLVHYIFHDHLWRAEGICYLQDLFTDASTRGQGVGKALIEGVYAKADEAGVPRVYWLTQEFNATARRLYDHVGKLTPFIRYDRP